MLYIRNEVAQAVHDYLMTRPMSEVEGLVIEMRRLAVVQQPKAADGMAEEPPTE